MPYYQLYHNRATCELKVTPLKKNFQAPAILAILDNLKDFETCYHNSFYYFANNKKVLCQVAKMLKDSWLSDAEAEVEKIRNIKI